MSIPDGTGHASAAGNDNERRIQLTRRSAIVTLLQCGVFAHAFGCHQLDAGPFQAESQPLVAAVGVSSTRWRILGEPFSDADRPGSTPPRACQTTAAAAWRRSSACSTRAACSSCASIRRAGSRSSAAPPPARLVEQGWRAFLIKVRNEAGVTGALGVESPQALPVYRPGDRPSIAPRSRSARPTSPIAGSLSRSTTSKPMEPQLSGLELEYRIVLLYSRDRGRREAQLGAIARDRHRGHRLPQPRRRCCSTSRRRATCTLRVRDEHGRPTHGVVPRRRTSSAASIRRDRSGSRRTSSSSSRSTAPTARRAAAGRRVHGHVRPRAGIPSRSSAASRSAARTGRARLQPAALDRSRRARLVFGRPPHPRRRLQPLRESDRGRAAGRHDAARPRRGAECRLRLELGAELLPSAAILRSARTTSSRRRPRCFATTSRSPAFRRATAAISSCCACATRTIPARGRSRTGRRGTCRSSSGRRRRAPSPASRIPGWGCT